jgi:hypothetical protein
LINFDTGEQHVSDDQQNIDVHDLVEQEQEQESVDWRHFDPEDVTVHIINRDPEVFDQHLEEY